MGRDLLSEIDEVDAEVDSLEESAAESAKRLQAQDRSHIAKLIVWLFLIVCIGTAVFFGVASLFSLASWESAGENLLTLLSSVILPVVTLVIGYYFGSEQR